MKEFSLEQAYHKLNETIKTYDFGTTPSNLYDPLYYILSLGGKRVRPLLTLLGTYLFTDEYEKATLPSLATEVFHNFSLIHDDIMDDAPLRRGKTTVHEKWNANVAILSGDVMMVKAYELLAHVPTGQLPEAIRLFNKCAVEVCEGQQWDMDFETRNDVSEAEYLNMIKLKTAVLLGFSLRLGALIGGASEKDAQLLEDFGVKVGIGFQLKDDLLDVFGEQAKVGKQVGGDIIANKKTFLLLHAVDKAEGAIAETLNKWIATPSFNAEEKVKAVTQIYLDLGIKTLTEQKVKAYFDEAFACLAAISAPKEKVAVLRQFAENLIEREK